MAGWTEAEREAYTWAMLKEDDSPQVAETKAQTGNDKTPKRKRTVIAHAKKK